MTYRPGTKVYNRSATDYFKLTSYLKEKEGNLILYRKAWVSLLKDMPVPFQIDIRQGYDPKIHFLGTSIIVTCYDNCYKVNGNIFNDKAFIEYLQVVSL